MSDERIEAVISAARAVIHAPASWVAVQAAPELANRIVELGDALADLDSPQEFETGHEGAHLVCTCGHQPNCWIAEDHRDTCSFKRDWFDSWALAEHKPAEWYGMAERRGDRESGA